MESRGSDTWVATGRYEKPVTLGGCLEGTGGDDESAQNESRVNHHY